MIPEELRAVATLLERYRRELNRGPADMAGVNVVNVPGLALKLLDLADEVEGGR